VPPPYLTVCQGIKNPLKLLLLGLAAFKDRLFFLTGRVEQKWLADVFLIFKEYLIIRPDISGKMHA
jgi:hypothetical protein